MVVMCGSNAIFESLKREKVKVIFGFPGGAIMPIYDALADSDIRHILVRHEQSASHMADGYARASGKVGVCMATSGPGSTNLVTGIATAFLDSSPMVAITGQVARSLIGKDAFQEIDIVGITTPIVKHNYLVRDVKRIPSAVKAAFQIAQSDRKGPVLIDIPRDVQIEDANISFSEPPDIAEKTPYIELSEEEVKRAAALLRKAERPAIIAGGGVISANASPELLTLARRLGAPVAYSLMGKGCIPDDHPLALGMLGMHGFSYVNHVVAESDILLSLGCRFSDRSMGGEEKFSNGKQVIQVEVDASEMGKNVNHNVPIVGNAKQVLKLALKELGKSPVRDSAWLKRVRELKKSFQPPWKDDGCSLKPPKLLKQLRELLPRNTIVATEVGQNQMWAAVYFESYLPRSFISSGGLGTMGFGFPAALGAKVAKPSVPVIDIAGDGSFLMNEHELATAVEEHIPVIVIVLNNRVLGMVAQWQRLIHKRYSQVHLGESPDFVKLAEAYGAQGLRAQSCEEFGKAVKEALSSEIVTVIDVPISPEEDVAPLILPTGVLNIG